MIDRSLLAVATVVALACAGQPQERRANAERARQQPPAAPAPGRTPSQMAEQVEAAIRAHYDGLLDANGYLVFEDAALPGTLSVKLIGIHPVRVVDEDHGSACGDFAGTLTQDGKSRTATADLDFDVSREGVGWKVVKLGVHRLDGIPR